jgi:hypothetical protein
MWRPLQDGQTPISRDDVPKRWLGPQEATRENPSLGPYSDDTWGTIVMETKTGDALWLANDTHNPMVIRVKGWDGWERQRGTLTLKTAAPVAKRQGDGLNAEYFTTESLDGNRPSGGSIRSSGSGRCAAIIAKPVTSIPGCARTTR